MTVPHLRHQITFHKARMSKTTSIDSQFMPLNDISNSFPMSEDHCDGDRPRRIKELETLQWCHVAVTSSLPRGLNQVQLQHGILEHTTKYIQQTVVLRGQDTKPNPLKTANKTKITLNATSNIFIEVHSKSGKLNVTGIMGVHWDIEVGNSGAAL
jgi:hypothetical protein